MYFFLNQNAVKFVRDVVNGSQTKSRLNIDPMTVHRYLQHSSVTSAPIWHDGKTICKCILGHTKDVYRSRVRFTCLTKVLLRLQYIYIFSCETLLLKPFFQLCSFWTFLSGT